MLQFRRGVLLLAAIACFGLSASAAAALDLVTQSALTNAAAAGNSYVGALSADGNSVVFLSHANNLVTNDNSAPHLDLFARDLRSNVTRLLSVNYLGTGGGNDNSSAPSVCSNGLWIAFESGASNLVAPYFDMLRDTNGVADVYVRDISSNRSLLVSINMDATFSGNGPSRAPRISADGRYVVFESSADNLVSNDLNQTNDLFLRDLRTSTTRLITFGSNGISANGPSYSPVITPDARFVAFISGASDIVPEATNVSGEVLVRDLTTNRVVCASTNVGRFFAGLLYRCLNPAISLDGRVVAFKAAHFDTFNTSPPHSPYPALVFRVELDTGVTTVLTSNSLPTTYPQISADGRFVAFEDQSQVYVYDAVLQSNILVSVTLEPSGGRSHTPIMSPDGAYVAFLSSVSRLATNSVNGLFQIYLRDLPAQTTQLISVTTNSTGGSIDLEAALPVISDDGHVIAFDTSDSQLVPEDLNFANDVFIRDAVAAMTTLVSQRHASATPATGASLTFLSPTCFSSNGQLLVFASMDSSFAYRDTNGFQDIFVRDLLLGTNFPVSVFPHYSTNEGVSGSPQVLTNDPFRANFLAEGGAISGNGGFVAYTWAKAAHQFSQQQQQQDVYVRDLLTEETHLVSRNNEFGGNTPSGDSRQPAINYDGSLIAYSGRSTSLVDPALGGGSTRGVYLRRGGTNYLVSINRTGNANGSGDSVAPIISSDNRWVLFYSTAWNLTADSISASFFHLFAHDLLLKQTRLLSFDQIGNPISTANSTGAVISANSRFVAFYATNPPAIYRSDLQSTGHANVLVCTNCSNPSISADGQFVAYESRDPASGRYNIYLADVANGVASLVSLNRTGTGAGNGSSRAPQLDRDARYIVFSSQASDLVDNDTNNKQDVFVRDLIMGTTMLLSRNAQGTGSGNGLSSHGFLAPDGRTVAFQSFSSDLVPADYNQTRDIFVAHLGGPDTDNDGVDDDWELAYFNTLSRDGSGDFDGDGQSDRQEFLAGTDPTNGGSVLRVVTVTPLNGGNVTLLWNSVAGRNYSVQFKNNVEDTGWSVLAQNIRASGSTASAIDNSSNGAGRRFYRVLLQR